MYHSLFPHHGKPNYTGAGWRRRGRSAENGWSPRPGRYLSNRTDRIWIGRSFTWIRLKQDRNNVEARRKTWMFGQYWVTRRRPNWKLKDGHPLTSEQSRITDVELIQKILQKYSWINGYTNAKLKVQELNKWVKTTTQWVITTNTFGRSRLQFTWHGKSLEIYHLDKYVFCISCSNGKAISNSHNLSQGLRLVAQLAMVSVTFLSGTGTIGIVQTGSYGIRDIPLPEAPRYVRTKLCDTFGSRTDKLLDEMPKLYPLDRFPNNVVQISLTT